MRQLSVITEYRWPTGFSAIYERLLRTVGTEEFESVVHCSINGVAQGVRRFYLFETAGPEQCHLRYASYEPGIERLLPLYIERLRRVDPYQEACRAVPRSSGLALLRLGASDAMPAGLRRHFFEESGIAERLSIVHRGEHAWRVMNIARDAECGRFSDREIDSIVALAGMTLPMLGRDSVLQAARPQLSVQECEARFTRRFAELTQRERQVCARAAVGMTVDGTALDLGIARSSIQTYRKRAYQRLRVSSSYELSALVMS